MSNVTKMPLRTGEDVIRAYEFLLETSRARTYDAKTVQKLRGVLKGSARHCVTIPLDHARLKAAYFDRLPTNQDDLVNLATQIEKLEAQAGKISKLDAALNEYRP
jgi:hypothetical protein